MNENNQINLQDLVVSWTKGCLPSQRKQSKVEKKYKKKIKVRLNT